MLCAAAISRTVSVTPSSVSISEPASTAFVSPIEVGESVTASSVSSVEVGMGAAPDGSYKGDFPSVGYEHVLGASCE